MPTPQPIMLNSMQKTWKKGDILEVQQIYRLVKREISLVEDDYKPSAPNNNEPRWQRNVRNILQYRKKTVDIEWLGSGRYRMS